MNAEQFFDFVFNHEEVDKMLVKLFDEEAINIYNSFYDRNLVSLMADLKQSARDKIFQYMDEHIKRQRDCQ